MVDFSHGVVLMKMMYPMLLGMDWTVQSGGSVRGIESVGMVNNAEREPKFQFG